MRYTKASNKLNLKIIIPIFAATLIGTIWMLLSKNNIGEIGLTDNYQAKQIIWHDETKYKGISISVNTTKDQFNEGRSTILVVTPVTQNKTINKTLRQLSQKFIDEFYKEAKKQESSYKKYVAETNLEAATFITNYVQHFDVSFVSEDYIAFIFNQHTNTGGSGNDSISSRIFHRASGKEIYLSDFFSNDTYLSTLSEISRTKLHKKYPQENNIFIEDGTTPKQENFDSVVLTQKGLLISFDKYQVAPGSEGIVKILIPFKDLSEFLLPKIKELFQ
ncbi:hypothetical protein AZO1586I_207 [Bathymodiolus thermophilus thioautotrophic gill symbiont]|jgi:hypothetical protein|uniref:[similarity to] secreted deoxyriboendonuclease n=3 Tax=sulfur-oxidizing symbionts TaxID=32036 RepID=A0A1H6JP70_9GAMM|nr:MULTISPECIES: RsiV family protein [sulfur-oxidizing symbionts]CAC9511481.1 hypothetical protein [uncultured Gammaproteobacteria bacterium]CAB5494314.1 hypothetical protein AZO1586R_55 [Bathymodiolus azoricus thioautotrophic gill symbiont]CAB5497628.1 hypothetical protein AZO1586I_207 [Bathymodiolus thermophilus thioautotrophic gill symbiont]CAC9514172.1 hypothetical protein [uncultured Gammaproteobacteria bacterium]CAC9988752.1 hypothetical protein [uncultured Gammaproteobacteria bacterium]